MKSLNFWLFLAFLAICNATHNSSSMSTKLRKELQEFARKRMDYMLKNGPPKEPHMTMSIALTDCRMITELPKIWSRWSQMILEEEVCSTEQMAQWCDEKPGRQAILTTLDEKTNRTALVQFKCHHIDPVESKHYKNRTRTVIKCIVAIALFAVIRGWYLACTRPVPVHPSKILNLSPPKSQQPDSFESITFDTTKTLSKPRTANMNFNNISSNKFRIY